MRSKREDDNWQERAMRENAEMRADSMKISKREKKQMRAKVQKRENESGESKNWKNVKNEKK